MYSVSKAESQSSASPIGVTIGTENRLNYTLLGDAVNVAAHVEQLNKQFGSGILATESTVRAAGALDSCVRLGAADVRNLADAAKASAKLGEIDRQLAALSGNGRLEKARTYLKDQLRKLKLASIEAV